MNTILNILHIFSATTVITSPLPNPNMSTFIPNVLSIVFGVVGALALLFITISGFKYITSDGDPTKAAKAKDGILYALVGIIVALAAEGIVAFFVRNI